MSFDIQDLDALEAGVDTFAGIADFILSKVLPWEDSRNSNYVDNWDEYYRMVKGVWSNQDKTRQSERSKAIMPTLAQAVETTVAEEEEATFGRKQWLIFEDEYMDDISEQEKLLRSLGLTRINKQFLDDCNEANVPSLVVESFLNGAIYGTGIAKVTVYKDPEWVPMPGGGTKVVEILRVKPEPISPYEFVIDPAARTIDDAFGMAHITYVPTHNVTEKMHDGIYKEVPVGNWNQGSIEGMSPDSGAPGASEIGNGVSANQHVRVIEYHGLIPSYLLPNEGGSEDEETPRYTEVIATILNDSDCVRCVKNPFPFNDRCFIAFQQDRTPGEFFGRGVVEKGYWPAKVINSEVRARTDALAFSTHPMMASNAMMIPTRGTQMEVRPGRNIIVNGNPSEALMPIKFPGPDPHTFQQTAEMERMVEMSTGAMQGATPTNINARNSTATGMSMIQGAFIKRSKRTMQSIERSFLGPFVRKALIRYMEFAPERYPFFDYRFKVNASLGIMAREMEQSQLTQMLQTVPPDSPAYWMILKSVYDNSSLSNKDEMGQLMDQMLQQSLQPEPEQPDLSGIAKIEAVKQRDKEHSDKMALEYTKIGSKSESEHKNRRLEYAKEAGK